MKRPFDADRGIVPLQAAKHEPEIVDSFGAFVEQVRRFAEP